jgi:hypothetical protein
LCIESGIRDSLQSDRVRYGQSMQRNIVTLTW